MKALLCVLRPLVAVVGLIGVTSTAAAEFLAQWNFNSNPPDPTNSFATGTTQPSVGSGTASLVGGATATFASGNVDGGSSDPTVTDDSAWNTATYPAQGTRNKMRGVQFNVSTLGFERILVTWDQRNSDGSSRYARFQYSVNGTDFVDGPVFNSVRFTASAERFDRRSVDLTSYPGVNNNPNFAFRIVAEMEATASGTGASNYLATLTNGTYGTTGTWRFDMVSVSGETFSGDQFPSISTISNQTMRMNDFSEEFPFTIGDFETPAHELSVSAKSSDQVLIPDDTIFLSGAGSNRTVTLFPGFDVSGDATITITVTDSFGHASSTSFVITVLPDNTPPVLSSFTNYHTLANTPLAPISFVIGDIESNATDLNVSGVSSNPTLIPNSSLVFGGSGSNRTVTITPAPQQTGNAIITVTVSDSELAASRQFAVMVVPSASVLLCDSFAYPDGPLNANSAFRWSNHSGTAGQTQVAGEEIRLVASQTEDISAVLIGAPYPTNTARALYAGFTINYKSLPDGVGQYFAHFRSPSGIFHARIFGTTTNAEPGSYRLAIANNDPEVAAAAVFPLDLTPQTEYVVVVRYQINSGVSTLWINPASEAGTAVTASDPPALVPILSWAFRQSTTQEDSIGTLHVDDLKVGLSFTDVVPGYRLQVTRTGSTLEISWPAAATDQGFFLESASEPRTPNWQVVFPGPDRVGDRDVLTITSPAGNQFYRLAIPF